jgi:hypothetical protein
MVIIEDGQSIDRCAPRPARPRDNFLLSIAKLLHHFAFA